MDLAAYRTEIDALDRQILEKINRRASLAVSIGKLKEQSEVPIYDPYREEEILSGLAKSNRGPLDDLAVRRIFHQIILEHRSLEEGKTQRRG